MPHNWSFAPCRLEPVRLVIFGTPCSLVLDSVYVISTLYLLFYIFTKISEGGLDNYRHTKTLTTNSLPTNNLVYF